MIARSRYRIAASWQPRIESPQRIAGRFKTLISLLQMIHPALGTWYHVTRAGACYDVDTLGDRLIDTIVGRVATGVFGEPQPWFGYHLCAYNCLDVGVRPEGLWLTGWCGGTNQGMLDIVTNDPPINPGVIVYDVFKGMLLAVARAFEPDWVSAAPNPLFDLLDMNRYTRPPMPIAWMIHLSPPIAWLVEPPSLVFSQRDDEGGLFMAATEDTFDMDNPRHLVGARAIEAVVDPLNFVLPFKTMVDWREPADTVK